MQVQRMVDYTADAVGAAADTRTKDAVAAALAHSNTVVAEAAQHDNGAVVVGKLMTSAVLQQRFLAADVDALLRGYTPLTTFATLTSLAALQRRAGETLLPRGTSVTAPPAPPVPQVAAPAVSNASSRSSKSWLKRPEYLVPFILMLVLAAVLLGWGAMWSYQRGKRCARMNKQTATGQLVRRESNKLSNSSSTTSPLHQHQQQLHYQPPTPASAPPPAPAPSAQRTWCVIRGSRPQLGTFAPTGLTVCR
jgi:hypothetical protein